MDKGDIIPPTPESFRRKEPSGEDRGSEEQNREQRQEHKKITDQNYEMSMNPYLERGYTLPYQVAQNRYHEQVFGHSQYRPNYHSDYTPKYNRQPPSNDRYEQQQRPQAPRTDRYGAHPLQVDRERRPEAYEEFNEGHSHRYIRAGHYRGGRPDLGFYQEDASPVPYPQEPLERRKDGFHSEPTETGFNPYKQPEKVRPNPGWYLMMRFHKDGESQVRHALYMCQKHIEADGGRVLGIARPNGILIHEGGESWVTFGKLRNYGDHLEVQQHPKDERTNYCVLVIFYPSLTRATEWFDRDGFFKQKDFPSPYATDCIVLPVHGSADTRFLKTLALTEYPKITYPEYFRDYFSIPTEDLMRKKFKAMPYVVKASSVPVDDPKQRVARHLRGSWIKRNSVITLSLFESLKEAVNYYTDPEYLRCKDSQDKVSAPTTVLMDLEDWRPPH